MRDPFEILGLEKSFALDPKLLAERHRELQKALHPDRYAQKPAEERRMALSKAIEVNEAVRALKDPVRRAEALARTMGLAIGETVEPKADPELLMEMMESREELADASRAKNAAKVRELGDRMRSRESATMEQLANAFRDQPARVVPLLGELRYLRRFLDEVTAFEDALFTASEV